MFEGEIIFYNGFNLLVDIVVGFTVWFFTSRVVRSTAHSKGIIDTLEGIDAGDIVKDSDNAWVLPCEDGRYITIDTNPVPTRPQLFAVPEAD